MSDYPIGRTVHVCLDIRGALRWPKRMTNLMAKSFHVEGRTIKTGDDVREYLMDCLAKGWKVLPMAECEGFSFETGCPGHPHPMAETVPEVGQ